MGSPAALTVLATISPLVYLSRVMFASESTLEFWSLLRVNDPSDFLCSRRIEWQIERVQFRLLDQPLYLINWTINLRNIQTMQYMQRKSVWELGIEVKKIEKTSFSLLFVNSRKYGVILGCCVPVRPCH